MSDGFWKTGPAQVSPLLVHSLCASVDSSRETAGVAREVKADIQIEEMCKDVPRNSSNRALSYICKDGIAQLGEEGGEDSRQTVCMVLTGAESAANWY